MARPREFDETVALDAAMNLFWARGYDATGLADLLDEMGIQRGSLYKAWGSKKGLFMAALTRYDELFIAPGIRFLTGEEEGVPRDGQDRISAVFSSHDDRGCLMCNSAGGIAGNDDDVAAWVSECMDRLVSAFETALRDSSRPVPKSDEALRSEAQELAQRYVGMRIGQRYARSK